MALPTFQEVWSRYLFNQKDPIKGDDLLNESIIRDNNNMELDDGVAFATDLKGTGIEINAVEFMENGPGHFINGANFGFVKNFFEPVVVTRIDAQNSKTVKTLTNEYLREAAQKDSNIKVDADGTIRFSLQQIAHLNEEVLGVSTTDFPNVGNKLALGQKKMLQIFFNNVS